MSFHVGQEVICVDGDWYPENEYTAEPPRRVQTGDILVILSMHHRNTGLHLEFAELPDWYWHHEAFRPLHKRSTETGFSILEDIRKKASEKKVVTTDA